MKQNPYQWIAVICIFRKHPSNSCAHQRLTSITELHLGVVGTLHIISSTADDYRKLSKPAKVIELLSDVKVAFGEGIINEALLTSAAAAYCDLGEPENAIRCCKWGYRVLRSKTEEYSDELSNVFARAKKMIDPSYSVREALDEKDMEDELRNHEALYQRDRR